MLDMAVDVASNGASQVWSNPPLREHEEERGRAAVVVWALATS